MFQLDPVPVRSDNYVWMIRRDDCDQAAVVDPGDDAPVLAALDARRLQLAAVIVTHHHGDHTAGIGGLVREFGCPVIGPESMPSVDRGVGDGDRCEIPGLEIELQVLAVPGHTLDHLALVAPGFMLCGDTLFAGGCGRVFEGTMEQMYRSLARLAALPESTLVCCGHEYTVANLEFARKVEPDNPAVAERLQAARELRREGRPTVPSRLAHELATNPFLRCREAAVVAAARRRAGTEVAPGAETFAAIRRWKDAD